MEPIWDTGLYDVATNLESALILGKTAKRVTAPALRHHPETGIPRGAGNSYARQPRGIGCDIHAGFILLPFSDIN